MFRIENKYGTEKTTRVASELHADAGFTDITSWKNVMAHVDSDVWLCLSCT